MKKTEKIKMMFGLVPGKDYNDDSELDKYIRAVDGYLGSLLVDTKGDEYSEEALDELDAIAVEVYPSAQAAFASRTGPVLSEDDAMEELLDDTSVAYIDDDEGFFIVFCNA